MNKYNNVYAWGRGENCTVPLQYWKRQKEIICRVLTMSHMLSRRKSRTRHTRKTVSPVVNDLMKSNQTRHRTFTLLKAAHDSVWISNCSNAILFCLVVSKTAAASVLCRPKTPVNGVCSSVIICHLSRLWDTKKMEDLRKWLRYLQKAIPFMSRSPLGHSNTCGVNDVHPPKRLISDNTLTITMPQDTAKNELTASKLTIHFPMRITIHL